MPSDRKLSELRCLRVYLRAWDGYSAIPSAPLHGMTLAWLRTDPAPALCLISFLVLPSRLQPLIPSQVTSKVMHIRAGLEKGQLSACDTWGEGCRGGLQKKLLQAGHSSQESVGALRSPERARSNCR